MRPSSGRGARRDRKRAGAGRNTACAGSRQPEHILRMVPARRRRSACAAFKGTAERVSVTNAGIAETSKARPNRHQRPSRLPRRASTTEVQPPQLNAVSEWAACEGYKRIKTSPAAEDGLHSHLRAQRKPALTTMGAGKMPRKKGSHRDASIGLVRRRGPMLARLPPYRVRAGLCRRVGRFERG